MKLKNIFLFVLSIFLFLSLTGCTQTQKQSTEQEKKTETKQEKTEDKDSQDINPIPPGWETYENKTHKLVLYYPQAWTFTPEIDKESLLTFSLSKNDESQKEKTFWDGTTGYPYYALAVRIEDNPQNLNSLDWAVKQVIPQAKEQAKEKYQEIKIGEYKGIYESGPMSPDGIMYNFIICPGNNKAYSFTYQADAFPETEEKFLEEVKKIISLAKLETN